MLLLHSFYFPTEVPLFQSFCFFAQLQQTILLSKIHHFPEEHMNLFQFLFKTNPIEKVHSAMLKALPNALVFIISFFNSHTHCTIVVTFNLQT